ncbi:hypothetical protein CRG98_001221 [Punica granatum]|uniref:Uncharacterized protein n=1 Tax=Punica granatum TaxID=22663 RepID=A0A2I0LCJ2_PUNGR|nr:hypothetical protein CRG98_001221 [Punica granatum]
MFASNCRVMNSNPGFGRGFSCRKPVGRNGVLTARCGQAVAWSWSRGLGLSRGSGIEPWTLVGSRKSREKLGARLVTRVPFVVCLSLELSIALQWAGPWATSISRGSMVFPSEMLAMDVLGRPSRGLGLSRDLGFEPRLGGLAWLSCGSHSTKRKVGKRSRLD